MRHGDKVNNLGRTMAHRKALLSNLACQLIEHKRITTTLAKARALRIYAEPLITRSKEDSMHNRRLVFGYLQDKAAVTELFNVIGDKVANRPGGYTRIIKLQQRTGDASDMAVIELVDFNLIYGKEAEEAGAKKTRRSRRGGGAKKTGAPDAQATAIDGTIAAEEHAQSSADTQPEADLTAAHTEAAETTEEAAATEGTETPTVETHTTEHTASATEAPATEDAAPAQETASAETAAPVEETTPTTTEENKSENQQQAEG
jgi:large subunit ribosomal protein L17